MVTGYLDIETTGLKADKSSIVAIGLLIEPATKPQVMLARNYAEERELLKWLKQEIKKCDKIVTWFGSGFDIPFIITRGTLHGITFPELAEICHFDLCLWVQRNLLLSDYSLSGVASTFGVETDKEFYGGDIPVLFKLAKLGDDLAAQETIKHCVADIMTLKQLHDKLKQSIDSLEKYTPPLVNRKNKNTAT